MRRREDNFSDYVLAAKCVETKNARVGRGESIVLLMTYANLLPTHYRAITVLASSSYCPRTNKPQELEKAVREPQREE